MPLGLRDWSEVLHSERTNQTLLWTSKYARKMVRSSLGGEVYAPSEMVDHTSLQREFCGPLVDMPRNTVGLEACESLTVAV